MKHKTKFVEYYLKRWNECILFQAKVLDERAIFESDPRGYHNPDYNHYAKSVNLGLTGRFAQGVDALHLDIGAKIVKAFNLPEDEPIIEVVSKWADHYSSERVI